MYVYVRGVLLMCCRCVITFFVELGYVALNETARELEQPFGLDANHHTLWEWHREFNEKLAGLLDLGQPDLGYAAEAEAEADMYETVGEFKAS
jgi:predicted membrane chloride channel (bestrophin family)